MSRASEAQAPEPKESQGFFRRLFGQNEIPGRESHSRSASASALDLGDIQGFILRGYRMPMVRHFLLTVGVPAEARKMLGRLVSGNESDAPQITTAEDWHVGFEPGPGDNLADVPRRKPDYCLNLGITWPGLLALEIKDRVPRLSFKSFGAFIAGAAERAKLVGDTGESDPQHWIGGFGTGSDHVLVTLHAMSPEAMTSYSDRLCALFVEGGGDDRHAADVVGGLGLAGDRLGGARGDAADPHPGSDGCQPSAEAGAHEAQPPVLLGLAGRGEDEGDEQCVHGFSCFLSSVLRPRPGS